MLADAKRRNWIEIQTGTLEMEISWKIMNKKKLPGAEMFTYLFYALRFSLRCFTLTHMVYRATEKYKKTREERMKERKSEKKAKDSNKEKELILL